MYSDQRSLRPGLVWSQANTVWTKHTVGFVGQSSPLIFFKKNGTALVLFHNVIKSVNERKINDEAFYIDKKGLCPRQQS